MDQPQKAESCSEARLPLAAAADEIVAGMTDGTDDISPKEAEDEGMGSAIETTPEGDSLNVSGCDSGFTSSVENLDLQCLECVLEWPKCNEQRSQDATKTLCFMCACSTQEHGGFEDYVHEIFMHRFSIEDKYHAPTCLDNQPDVSADVRGGLVRWLTRIHHSLRLTHDTLFLTVNIMDRVLNIMLVAHDCLELLAITCLLVAAKQNEVCVPEISDLLYRCKDRYTREQVRQLEIIILMATGFDLMPPTTQQFLEYFASFCLAKFEDEDEHIYKLKMARAVGRCILELSLQVYEFCRFCPSLLAMCVWKASVKYVDGFDGNFYPSPILVKFSLDQYESCLAEVNTFVDKFPKDLTKYIFV